MPEANNSINSLKRKQGGSAQQTSVSVKQKNQNPDQNNTSDQSVQTVADNPVLMQSDTVSNDNTTDQKSNKRLKKMIPGYTEICRIEGKVHGKFINMSLKYGNMTDYTENEIPKRISEELYERKLEEFLNSEAGQEYAIPTELEKTEAITAIKNYIMNTKDDLEKKRIEDEVQARLRLENEKRVAELYGHEEPKGDIPDDGFHEKPVNVDEYEEVKEETENKKEPLIKNLFNKTKGKKEEVFEEDLIASQGNHASTDAPADLAKLVQAAPHQDQQAYMNPIVAQDQIVQSVQTEKKHLFKNPFQKKPKNINDNVASSQQPIDQPTSSLQQSANVPISEPIRKEQRFTSESRPVKQDADLKDESGSVSSYADPEEIAKHVKLPKTWIVIMILLTLINIGATVAIGLFGGILREMSMSRLGMGELSINGETYSVPLSEIKIENGESKTVFYAITSANKDGEVKTEAYPIGEWKITSEKVSPN